MDRFLMKEVLTYPSLADEADILERVVSGATGQDRSWRVQVTGRTVSVTMERDLPTTTLRLVGVDGIHVEVTGQARLAVGTRQEGDS